LRPARPLALPVFLPLPVPRDATLWTILSWVSAPLHGISRTSRQRHLCRRHLSGGSTAPTAHAGRESPRPSARLAVRDPASPALPGWCTSGSHPASYGAAHRFSQPRSGFFLSPPSRHFQASGARGVRPTGICSLCEASTTRRRRHTLSTFFPRTARPPFLGGGIRGRACRCLGCSAWRL
jgi:hypothetical protein